MDIALTLNFDHRALIHPEVRETIRRNSLKASVRYRVDQSGGGGRYAALTAADCIMLDMSSEIKAPPKTVCL